MEKIKIKRDVKLIPCKTKLLVSSSEHKLLIEGRRSITLAGRLAPLISRTVHRDEVIQQFRVNDRDAVAAILEELCQGGMITNNEYDEGNTLEKICRAQEPSITFIGHATLLIKTKGLSILTDPWIFLRDKNIRQPPYPITFEDLPDLDLICVSHSHNDHMHIPTLFRLNKETPVLVPKIENPNKYNRSPDEALFRLGFERIICLRPWESFRLKDLTITRTPCHKSWMVTEQATWMIESPEIRIFCGNDMMEDERLMRHLGDNYKIDTAFLPISGYSRRIGSAINDTEVFPAELHGKILRDVMGIKEAVQATQWMRPRFAIGYANGGAYWYKHPEGSLTEGPGSEFVELLMQRNTSVSGVDMRPGDIWEHRIERIIR